MSRCRDEDIVVTGGVCGSWERFGGVVGVGRGMVERGGGGRGKDKGAYLYDTRFEMEKSKESLFRTKRELLSIFLRHVLDLGT